MEWLVDLLGVGASAASGGIFGFLGGIGSTIAKYFQENQRQNWKREEWKYELELLKMQREEAELEREHDLAIVAQEGSFTALNTSLASEGRMTASPWANNVRTLFRPFLTLILCSISALVFYEIMIAIQEGQGMFASLFTNEEMRDLIRYMVYTIFFAASTAALWWFAERSFAPPGLKNR